MRLFCKRSVFLINVEFIGPVIACHNTGITNIYIQPAITVNVDHGNTGMPFVFTAKIGFGGNIFKL